MGHSSGKVYRNDELVGHFVYDGYAAIPNIYKTFDEIDIHWHNHPDVECTCGHIPVEIILWASYGSGFYWYAKACLNCSVIVDRLDPYAERWIDDNSGGLFSGPETGHPLGEINWPYDGNGKMMSEEDQKKYAPEFEEPNE